MIALCHGRLAMRPKPPSSSLIRLRRMQQGQAVGVRKKPGLASVSGGTLCALLTACMVVGGCAAPGSAPAGYSSRRVSTVAWADAFDRAREVLADQGYRLAQADPAEGVLQTRPVPASPQEARRRSRIRFSSPRSLQRVVLVRLARTADSITVYCRVALRERVTEAHRLLQHSLVASDLPGETPIDREGATTPEQNTVWRTVRRDKVAEQAILEAILAKTGTP